MSDQDVVDVYGYPLDAAAAAAWQRSVGLARRGDLVAAVSTLRGLLVRQPEFVPAMVQLAHWLLALDHYREAWTVTRNAAAAGPSSHELVLEIVRLLRRFEDPVTIDDLLRGTDWGTCESASLLVRLVAELGPAGMYGQAWSCLSMAEGLEPTHPALGRMRATLQMVSGDLESATASLRRLLESNPRPDGQLRWMLSLQSPETAQAERDAQVLAERLQDRAAAGEDEAFLAFALHNTLHSLGRYDEAWTALTRGCAAKRALVPYHRDRQLAMFRMLQDMPRLQPSWAARHGEPAVVFVVGMHRSGTTLLERMLAGHSDIVDGGESYAFSAALRQATDHYCPTVLDHEVIRRISAQDLAGVGSQYAEYARWKSDGRGWLTEKLPSNFLNLGFILAAMPSARILHMRRDPLDTCFSNLRTYFSNAAAYSYGQAELAEYYRHYLALMEHWHVMWPGRILDVDYQALVEQPEQQIRRVAGFCGFDFQPSLLEVGRREGAVATASVADVRRGIRKDRGGQWRHYAAHLGPLIEGLRGA